VSTWYLQSVGAKGLLFSCTSGVLPWPYPTLGQKKPHSNLLLGVLGCCGWAQWGVGLRQGDLAAQRWALDTYSLKVRNGCWSPAIQVSSLDLIPPLVRPTPLQPDIRSVVVLWMCSVGRWAEAGWSASSVGEHLSLGVQRDCWSPALQVSSLDLIPPLVRPTPLLPPLESLGMH